MSVFKRSFKKSTHGSKPSAEVKSRLEHQLYLARECPDPVFDISSCELSEVPKGVFSLCKVLNKESLLLHNNNLSCLKSEGNMLDLSALRILDLHYNQLKELPEDIGKLRHLQILNLEHNLLRSLPDSIVSLSALQTLNIKGNQLKNFPNGLCQLCSLRFLDVSDNFITRLPSDFCQVRTLEVITVDAGRMIYPNSAICSQGTEAIMRVLCQSSGRSYIPPSQVLLNILPSTSNSTTNRDRIDSNSSIESTVMQYENLKEKKRKERLAVERQLEEDQKLQSLLSTNALMAKTHLVEFVASEHQRLNTELVVAHQRKEIEKEKLRNILIEAEQNAGELIAQLLEINERARKTEELLEKMEKERVEVEQWYSVRQGELENIRRKDVFSSMKDILRHNELLAEKISAYLTSQDDSIKRSKHTHQQTDKHVEDILSARQRQQQTLVEHLMTEESLQRELFEVLQYQKDARHRRITSQIRLIEQELAELTVLEIEQKTAKLDIQMNVLAEKRKALTLLLLQLMDEQSKRKQELRARLIEMEDQRMANQTDYWLVQYQRLLDSKPQSFVDQERQLEIEVIKILECAGASDYLVHFARNRISIETLVQMTDADLEKIGIRELGLQKAILKEAAEYRKLCMKKDVEQSQEKSPKNASEDTREELFARGINSECVICLDSKSSVLFLNCGHICTCAPCSENLKSCPLDRCEVIRKIHIVPSMNDFDEVF